RPNQRRSERQYDGRRYERQDKGKLKSCASVLIPLRLELKNNASGKARTWGGSFDFLADDNLGGDAGAPRHHPYPADPQHRQDQPQSKQSTRNAECHALPLLLGEASPYPAHEVNKRIGEEPTKYNRRKCCQGHVDLVL